MVMAEKQVEAPRIRIITPTAIPRLGYVDAFNAMRDKGGLTSNVIHDDVLVKLWDKLTDEQRAELRKYYPAWAREIVVYPAEGGVFKAGQHVEDGNWFFPTHSIPKEAIDRPGVGLFVDPKNLYVEGKRVVVEADPSSIVLLTNFMQKEGWSRVDERTRIPLAVSSNGVPDGQQRYFWRISGQGVRPLARGVDDFVRRDVGALYRRDYRFGVASLSLTQAEPALAVAPAEKNADVFMRGATKEELRETLRDADACLSKLAETSKAELLDPLRRLVNNIGIKE